MKKSEKYGVIGTIVFSIILLLILLFFGLSMSREEREEGIMVSFGDGLDGVGAEQAVVAPTVATTPPPPTPSPSTPSSQDLMTQEDPSVALNAKREKERIKREQLEQQRVVEQQKQEEIRRQKEIERQKQAAAAERQRKADQAKAAAAGAFGGGGNTPAGTGPGSGGKGTTPGNPIGQGSSGGPFISGLEGRTSSNVGMPNYTSNDEGFVVVEITVDKNGIVVGATIGQSTISDATLRKECIAAAKRIRFNAVSKGANAYGKITYKFGLN